MNFTFFSSAHGTFSRIDHILGHKSSLGKFKKIEIIPSIFSYHNAVRLDLNYRRKTIKNSNIWRLSNTLLNNQQITEEMKICRNKLKLKHNNPNPMGYCKSSGKSFVSFSLISDLIFKISFLLLTLRFFIYPFSSCFRYRVRLFI